MAWRPTEYLKSGELDNTILGKITGWMEFAGLSEKVQFKLEGDFHRDIRGAKIAFRGDGDSLSDIDAAKRYMEGFSTRQTGQAGDITGGFEPADYIKDSVYIEWYGNDNGRIVLELDQSQIEVIGKPIPAMESFPISRQKQHENMTKFLGGMAQELGLPAANCICVGVNTNSSDAHDLLPDEIRKQLPPLYSQDGKGGKAIAHLKLFVGSWTWWATEFDGDDTLFGLVEGFEKELGYFSLSELQGIRGPLGLPVECDLHFTSKTLEEIAPEMFRE